MSRALFVLAFALCLPRCGGNVADPGSTNSGGGAPAFGRGRGEYDGGELITDDSAVLDAGGTDTRATPSDTMALGRDSTDGLLLPTDAESLLGTWTGYVENYLFDDGTDAVR